MPIHVDGGDPLELLKRTFPTTSTHRPRLLQGRRFVAMLAVIVLAIAALWIGIDEIPAQPRVIGSGVIAATGVLLLIGSAAGPGTWMAGICETLTGGNSIESVLELDDDSSSIDASQTFLELGILTAVVLLANLGFLAFDFGNIALACGILIPTGLWVATVVYRQKYRRPKAIEVAIAPSLDARGYDQSDPKSAQRFLRQTFLRDDVSLQVQSFWQRSVLTYQTFWGRYGTSGNSLNAGIFFGLAFTDRPDPYRVGQIMSHFGTVYLDDGTWTLFGTLKLRDDPLLRVLTGVPWQMLSDAMVFRIKDDLLNVMYENYDELRSGNMEQFIDAAQRLAERVDHEIGELRQLPD